MSVIKYSKLTLSAAVSLGVTTSLAQDITGPSSSQSPYIVPVKPGVVTISLLTVGDAVNYRADGVTPYRMAGIPDGLGAFDNGDGTFTVLMNHEIASNRSGPLGIVRDHGFPGAFVSRWIIARDSLRVLHGEDLIKYAWRWDLATSSYHPVTNAFLRFCSADLPPISAFYNDRSGKGYSGRIYLNGEESGTEGRAFAHLMDGNTYELPWLGKLAWENCVANGSGGDKTIVMGTDDGVGGQVYVYVGARSEQAAVPSSAPA